MKTSRILWVMVAAIVLVSLLVSGFGCKAPAATPTTAVPTTSAPTTEAPGVIKLGVVMPISGPAAQWGLPSARGAQVWADLINADGGVEVAGKKYLIEMHSYDDPGFEPAAALTAVKNAFYQDGVRIFNITPTASVVEAVAAFLQEVGGILVPHGASAYIRPEWPFVFAGMTLWPVYQTASIMELHKQCPEVKTAAVLYPDMAYVPDERPYINIGLRVAGIEKVYEEIIPANTVDYAPVLSAALATNPDMITLDSVPSAFVPDILSVARGLGYEGKWHGNTWEMGIILQKVPADYVEGAYVGSANLDNPSVVDPMIYRIYQEYTKRWPPDFVLDNLGGVGTLSNVVRGMQLAGTTTDINKIVQTMHATDPFPTMYFGDASWGGKEIFGADYMLMSASIPGIVRNGKSSVAEVWDWPSFYKANLPIIIEEFEAEANR